MTDDQFKAWLSNPSAIRCVLVEVVSTLLGVDTTHYLSTVSYTTEASATPSNQYYSPVLSGGITINEKLSIDSSASLSFGDIELSNPNGELDDWLDYIWTNRPIIVLMGDVRWPRSDFRTMFVGILDGIASRTRATLNLSIRDKLQRLNTPITEVKLGGTTSNKDVLIPLCFGEVHNISPLLIDPATLTYQVHDGRIESIIEVRDNGVPVDYTTVSPYGLSEGKFRLVRQPFGVITCSVQGDAPSGVYSDNIADIVYRIVTSYGKISDVLASTDVDLTQFGSFASAHTQHVGVYVSDRQNVLTVCAQIASSVKAQLVMNRLGLLQLKQISLTSVSPTVVDNQSMTEKSFSIVSRPQIIAAVVVAYCKNYTVQSTLETGLPQEHKDLFAREWLTANAIDTDVATVQHLATEPTQEDTCLLSLSDASTEATRRLNLWKTQRTVVSYSGTASLLLEQLGAYQTITHTRFGFSGGKTGQILSIAQDLCTGKTQFEVLV